jgi:hypothetical protein
VNPSTRQALVRLEFIWMTYGSRSPPFRAGFRIVLSRTVVLSGFVDFSVMSLMRVRLSSYVPSSTMTVSPSLAALIAAWMVVKSSSGSSPTV